MVLIFFVVHIFKTLFLFAQSVLNKLALPQTALNERLAIAKASREIQTHDFSVSWSSNSCATTTAPFFHSLQIPDFLLPGLVFLDHSVFSSLSLKWVDDKLIFFISIRVFFCAARAPRYISIWFQASLPKVISPNVLLPKINRGVWVS